MNHSTVKLTLHRFSSHRVTDPKDFRAIVKPHLNAGFSRAVFAMNENEVEPADSENPQIA